MHYTVYKVTNDINGKVYIGTHKTKNVNDGYMGSGKYLKRAIEKHGPENFTKEILFDFDNSQEMFEKERELVTLDFISEENTYNLKVGGFGGWDHENLDSIKQRNKCLKGIEKQRWLRENDSTWRENVKIKLSIAMKKRNIESGNKYQKLASEAFKLKGHTLESKSKIGLANKGKVPWNKGKSHSEETKQKISDAVKKRNAQLV